MTGVGALHNVDTCVDHEGLDNLSRLDGEGLHRDTSRVDDADIGHVAQL